MLLNLSELFLVEGKSKEYSVKLDPAGLNDRRKGYVIKESTPVSLTITNKNNKSLLVEGRGELNIEMPCSRCLEPVSTLLRLDVEEEIVRNAEVSQKPLGDEEQFYVNGYNLDVDQLIDVELALNLPVKILCDEHCKGICGGCGANLNRVICNCERPSRDPRMSVIQDIFKQFKEV